MAVALFDATVEVPELSVIDPSIRFPTTTQFSAFVSMVSGEDVDIFAD